MGLLHKFKNSSVPSAAWAGEVASDESSALDGPARVSPANDGTEKVVEVHNDNLAHKEKVLISSGRTASMQCIVLPAVLGLLFGCVVM